MEDLCNDVEKEKPKYEGRTVPLWLGALETPHELYWDSNQTSTVKI
jgi:hypothetical protein